MAAPSSPPVIRPNSAPRRAERWPPCWTWTSPSASLETTARLPSVIESTCRSHSRSAFSATAPIAASSNDAKRSSRSCSSPLIVRPPHDGCEHLTLKNRTAFWDRPAGPRGTNSAWGSVIGSAPGIGWHARDVLRTRKNPKRNTDGSGPVDRGNEPASRNHLSKQEYLWLEYDSKPYNQAIK